MKCWTLNMIKLVRHGGNICQNSGILRTIHLPFLFQTRTIANTLAGADASSHHHRDIEGPLRDGNKALANPERSLPASQIPDSNLRRNRGRSRRDNGTSIRANNHSSTAKRASHGAHVPFQIAGGTSDHSVLLDGMTMTSRERNAFQALINKATRQKLMRGDAKDVRQTTEDPAEYGLEKLLEGAFYESIRSAQQRVRPSVADDQDINDAKLLIEQHTSPIQYLRGDHQVDISEELLEQVLRVYIPIRNKLNNAQSDAGLWQQLQSHVFDKIDGLALGAPSHTVQTLPRANEVESREDRVQIWAICLPQILSAAVSHLDSSFPASSLGLCILPALKRLGPSSFALGATTKLYNEHLRMLHVKSADIYAFNATLSEMYHGVYQFNSGTQNAIRAMLKYINAALREDYGAAVQAIWNSTRRKHASDLLSQRYRYISSTLKREALRKSRDRDALFSTDLGDGLNLVWPEDGSLL